MAFYMPLTAGFPSASQPSSCVLAALDPRRRQHLRQREQTVAMQRDVTSRAMMSLHLEDGDDRRWLAVRR
jgi:hypothetical protein